MAKICLPVSRERREYFWPTQQRRRAAWQPTHKCCQCPWCCSPACTDRSGMLGRVPRGATGKCTRTGRSVHSDHLHWPTPTDPDIQDPELGERDHVEQLQVKIKKWFHRGHYYFTIITTTNNNTITIVLSRRHDHLAFIGHKHRIRREKEIDKERREGKKSNTKLNVNALRSKLFIRGWIQHTQTPTTTMP